MTPSDARRIFRRERDAFAFYFPHVARTKFIILNQQCTDGMHCKARDLAFAQIDPPSVSILRRALSLPIANLIGLIRHELGHVADERIHARGAEQRADDIAEYVTGHKIFYDTRDIQTVSRGKYPRPRYLHR